MSLVIGLSVSGMEMWRWEEVINEVGREVRPLRVKGCLSGDKYLHFEMSQEELAKIADLKVLPSFGRANVGDEGYFVSSDGMLSTFKQLSKDARRERIARVHMLPANCFKVGEKCYAGIMKGMEYESHQVVALVDDKEYQYYYHYNTLQDIVPYEPLSIDFYPLEGKI